MRRPILLSLCALALLAPGATAQPDAFDERAPEAAAPPADESRLIPPDHPALVSFADAIERMQEEASPDPQEERLRVFVGDWSFTTDLHLTPTVRVRTIEGAAHAEWALGRRAVRLELTGRIDLADAHADYAGLGLLAYDHTDEAYRLVWRDSLSTAATIYTGTFDDAGDLVLEADAPQGRLRMTYLVRDGAFVGTRTGVSPGHTGDFRPNARTDLATPEPAPELAAFAVRFRAPAPIEPAQRPLFARHLAHLRRLTNEGRVALSGSVGGDDADELVILRAADADEARALVADDPAVAAGLLGVEVEPFDLLYADPASAGAGR